MPRLLIVAHAPSPNTLRLREAAARGALHPDIEDVEVVVMPPLEAGPEDVRACDAILCPSPNGFTHSATNPTYSISV